MLETESINTPKPPPITMHMIANAHLDPVWLWDWREGLSEVITTARTIIMMMKEYPELTFSRGETYFYRTLEAADPLSFRRILEYVEQGRWEVAGAWFVQPDLNMPSTETLLRHLLHSQRYFLSRFFRIARTAWSADAFGHSATLPDLLAAARIKYYACYRPLPVNEPNTFWWQGPAGGRVLVHRPPIGFYGNERHDLMTRLDELLARASGSTLKNVACFYGLGDHGGHPTRHMLADIHLWADTHPEVRVLFSGMERFFDSISQELDVLGEEILPTVKGEINFTGRGIYAAVAKFKFAYRKVEASLIRAEQFGAAVSAATGKPAPNLSEAWEAVLFNTFHDALPGSSIERVYNEQLEWLGSAAHAVRQAELMTLRNLAENINTLVRTPAYDMPAGISFLVVNPHPYTYQGPVELEANLDYRPIWAYENRVSELPVAVIGPDGDRLPCQIIEPEHQYSPHLPFRTRVITNVTLPPFGWSVFEYAYEEGAPVILVSNITTAQEDRIGNGIWEVRAHPGETGVRIYCEGKPLFADPGLFAVTVEDPWGVWGGMFEEPESIDLSKVLRTWKISRVEAIERGPLRSTLQVRLEAGHSQLDLAFSLTQGRDVLDVSARLFWDERCARLKLGFPGMGGYQAVTYEIPGGSITRGGVGEVPGRRWALAQGTAGDLGFASDALYAYNLKDGIFYTTLARATRYTADYLASPDEHPWRPVVDRGELRLRFLLTRNTEQLARLADQLEQPPLVWPAPSLPGPWGRSGSLFSLAPDELRMIAIKPAEDGNGYILRLHNPTGRDLQPHLTWLDQQLPLKPILPKGTLTFRLMHDDKGIWSAERCGLLEW